MKFHRSFSIFFILSLLISIPSSTMLFAASVRKPVWAGAFYPASKAELKKTIEILTSKAQLSKFKKPKGKHLRALIMPHAGYIYSGYTAAHVSLLLEKEAFSKVILTGPDHRVGINFAAISDVTAYETPFGSINIHPDAEKLRDGVIFKASPESDRSEHSLEVILPFLQYYLGPFEFVPIVMGHADITVMTEAIKTIIDDQTLLVASSDLSHYLSYNKAVHQDSQTLRGLMTLNRELLLQNDNRACGAVPILVLLNLAERNKWRPYFIHYSNSGDTAGDKSRVVGYTVIAFYGDETMGDRENTVSEFSKKQGQVLCNLARKTITEKLGKSIDQETDNFVELNLADPAFKAERGTFVTLHKKGELRGCIGNLTASGDIVDSVKHNALSAAFNDHRFTPVTAEELDDIDLEVSILSDPSPLEYSDAADLINKLQPGIDGVILRKGHMGATFLPQVWEQLPRPEDFLTYLCRKAGLPSDTWRTSSLEIMTYRVQYFEEEKNNPDI